MPQYKAALVGRLTKHGRADGQQTIKPATGLVDGFTDKLRGKSFLKLFLVFKGIVPLGKGHSTRIVPAVKHLFFAVHILPALGAAQYHTVDVGPVQLRQIDRRGAHLLELLHTANHMDMSLRTGPHRQGRAPIAFA